MNSRKTAHEREPDAEPAERAVQLPVALDEQVEGARGKLR
jgi:hypothetical protein